MTFEVYTLGCKVNFYESYSLREMFLLSGYKEVEKNPDVVVINTCSVTAQADQKSRQIVRRFRRNNPNAIIAVMGCSSQKNGDYLLNECDADIVVGTSYRNMIPEYIKDFAQNHKKILNINTDVRHLKYESFPAFVLPNATRAFIKIEDGCNNFCTYCTIPYTRGQARSRNKDEIIKEIQFLIENGYKEFVLTGVHTAHYGIDLQDITFSALVEEIVNIPSLYRLRISSIEESEIDDKFISLLGKYPSIADHLHMPLQSGSKTVLKRMGRKYNVDDFINKVNRIRKVRPDIAITTDVIVGFPGETEEEFNETVEFIKKVNFAELHVFPFSAREGTKAFDMPNKVDPKIKDERVQTLIKLSNELMINYRNKFIGKEMEVIMEERSKQTGLLSGFTSNYLKVDADFSDKEIGNVVKVVIE